MTEESDLDEKTLEEAYDSLYRSVGRVAVSWNALHENLCDLFAQVAQVHPWTATAIWHSTPSDRSQREMLRAALNSQVRNRWPSFPKVEVDVEWLLNEVDKLANRRNNAVHAPYLVQMLGMTEETTRYRPVADWGGGNPRAHKLYGKEVLAELRFYTDTARVLASFTEGAWAALREDDVAWPDRPRLPSLGRSHSRS